MLADRPAGPHNHSLTCRSSCVGQSRDVPGAVQSCLAGNDEHWPTAATCAKYVPKIIRAAVAPG